MCKTPEGLAANSKKSPKRKPKSVQRNLLDEDGFLSPVKSAVVPSITQWVKNLQKIDYFLHWHDILTRKVVLWSFFMSETSEKSHNSTLWVKISV